MNQATFIDLVQSAAWLLTLVELIIALYILVLNSRDRAPLHLSGLLVVFAINSFAVGSLVVTQATWQAKLPTVLLAATSPMVGTGVLLTTAVMLRPRWFKARYRRMRWVAYGTLMAPVVLTFIDLLFGAGLWYTGINPGEISGGTIPLEAFTQGALSFPVRMIGLYITPLLALVPIATTLFDQSAEHPTAQKLARWLLAAQIGALIIQFGTRGVLASSVRSLLASTLYAAVYTYATFYGLLTERWSQHGRLRTRLTATVLVITLPTVLAAVTLVRKQMGDLALENANHNFHTVGNATASHVTTWLNSHKQSVLRLAADPAIMYIDSARQQTVLDTLTAVQPDLMLAQIVGPDGISIARSDGQPGTDNSSQTWYTNTRTGDGLTLEISHSPLDGTNTLIAAAPIDDATMPVPGAVMLEIGLAAIRTELSRNKFGATGVVYVVDKEHQVVAAPDTEDSDDVTLPLHYPPIEELEPDASQLLSFTDGTREMWVARVFPIDDNWSVIVQQSRADIMSSPRSFSQVQGLIVATGLVLLSGLIWLSVRQALLPVDALTQTAIAVASGDLSRAVPVQSQDEIGTLAVAFNQMTSRVRDLVQNLENRVTEQTRELERRSIYLEAGALVARRAAAIRDSRRLMDEVVHAISDRYGFYHAGMFLIDDRGEYAVLQAASSDGGRRMLNRNHRLRIGQVGIVGYVADTGEARIALDVGDDAVYFDNPDMPDTRSEMALPLTVGNEVIGVLDVQSNERNAFTEEDVSALQTMADQVAIALENARLLEESHRSLQQLENTTRQRIGSAWREWAALHPTAYRYTGVRVEPAKYPGGAPADRFPDQIQIIEDSAGRQIIAPVRLRGQILATIALRQDAEAIPWNTEDAALVERLTAQIGIALENARMLDEIRARADQERFVAEISAKVRASMNPETILRTAVREIGVALGTDKAYVQLIEGTDGETYGRVDISPVSAAHNQITNLAISRGETISYASPESTAALAAPLKVHNQVIGAIGLEADDGQQWLPQEIALVKAVSTQVAQALENARLFLETQQAAQRMSALYTVGSTISRLGNLGSVFESLASVLVDQLGFTNAWIALVDRQGETLTGIADAGTGVTSETSTRRIPLQQGARNPAVRAVLERTHVVINDVGTDDRALDLAAPVRAALGRMMVTPIMVGDRAAGVVAVDRPLSTPALSEADAELLRSIADQAAVALQNADLLEETRRRASQLSAAAAVARDATSTLNVDQLMDQTVTLISEQFNYYHAGVFLIDNDSEYAILRAGSSEGSRRMLEKGHKLRIGQVGIVGHVAHTGEPRIALDVGSDAVHFVNPDLPDTRSEMGLPLTVRDSVIGVLDVQSTEAGAFVEDDIAVLQTLADQLASAIANARLFEAVQHDATRRALINEVQRAAVTSLQPEKLLTNAATVISRRIRRASAMFLWNRGKRVLQNTIVCDAHGDEIMFDHKINLTHASHPQILSKLIDSPRTYVPSAGEGEPVLPIPEFAQAVYVPLVARNESAGIMVIADNGQRQLSEIDLLEILAANLGVALENAHLYQNAMETAEQLKEIDRLKSQFLANMSHELRTPLNSIIGFSRVILKGIDGPLTEMQHTDLQAVFDSGQHLLGLINDILDISKIQAGKMELAFEPTDLREIIRGVMSTAVALVKNAPIELRQNLSDDLPIVRADPRRIRQVLLNLVGNAAKFTEAGQIEITAATTASDVIVTVSDTGIGIPEDKLEGIFEEFSQVDGSSTRRAGGSGLGLSISRHFLEMHGGRIWVESAVGLGSVFSFALPTDGPGPNDTIEPEIESHPQPVEDEDTPILCVDDDQGVILLFERYLSQLGYRVVGLTDSASVVETARRIRPFAIILDVLLPHKDGWSVISDLKSNPDTQDIPVIICSIINERDRGLSLGAVDYLQKPILEDDLISVLQRLEATDGGHRILIVDDSSQDRDLIQRFLRSQGHYEVTEAKSGEEALASINDFPPDLIILDLMMPDVDGFAVIEWLRSSDLTRSIPTIIVTAKELTGEESDALSNKTTVVLQKGSFHQQKLLAAVGAALRTPDKEAQ